MESFINGFTITVILILFIQFFLLRVRINSLEEEKEETKERQNLIDDIIYGKWDMGYFPIREKSLSEKVELLEEQFLKLSEYLKIEFVPKCEKEIHACYKKKK